MMSQMNNINRLVILSALFFIMVMVRGGMEGVASAHTLPSDELIASLHSVHGESFHISSDFSGRSFLSDAGLDSLSVSEKRSTEFSFRSDFSFQSEWDSSPILVAPNRSDERPDHHFYDGSIMMRRVPESSLLEGDFCRLERDLSIWFSHLSEENDDDHSPLSSPSPVPLPSSAILLGTALTAFTVTVRHQLSVGVRRR